MDRSWFPVVRCIHGRCAAGPECCRARDMEGFMDTAMGKRLEKAPIAVFRIANVVIVALIVIAEMMAIY